MEIMVHKTSDYQVFKRLESNRDVKNGSVKKIIRSIEKVGAIPNPLIVNEHMQIIDGQNRLEALKSLSLPVYYIIIPGLTVEHCRAMNINQSNWGLMDYIKSYAEEGNENYVNFIGLLKKYKTLGITPVFCAVTGLFGLDNRRLKDGTLSCDKENFKRSSEALEYCMEYTDVIGRMDGRRDLLYVCILFCFWNESVDRRRLKDKFCSGYKMLTPTAKVDQALDEISDLYNAHLKSDRIYLKTDYYKYLESKFKWYDKKWGQKKRDYLTQDI